MHLLLLFVLFSTGLLFGQGDPGTCESDWQCSTLLSTTTFTWKYPVCGGNSIPDFSLETTLGGSFVRALCSEGDTCVGVLSTTNGANSTTCTIGGIGTADECLYGLSLPTSGTVSFNSSNHFGGADSTGLVDIYNGYAIVTDSRNCPGCTGFICYNPANPIASCVGGNCTAVVKTTFLNVGLVPFIGTDESGTGSGPFDATCYCASSDGCNPKIMSQAVNPDSL